MELTELEDLFYHGSFDEILEISVNDEDHLSNLFKCYHVLVYTTSGDYEKASSTLDNLDYLRHSSTPLERMCYYYAAIDYYLKTRKLDDALSCIEKALSYYNSLDTDSATLGRYYGIVVRLRGTYMAYTGEYIDATEIFSQCISIQQTYNGEFELPRAYSNRAATLYWLGDIDGALEDGLQAYELLQEQRIDSSENFVGVTNNVGLIYFSKNQLDKAKEFFTRSLKASQQLGNPVYSSLNLHNLIRTHNLLKQVDISRQYLDKFGNTDHPFISMIYRLSKAMVYLHSSRIQEIAEGQRVINNVINEPVIDHQFRILAIFTAVDYLLLELAKFEDTALLPEINDLLVRIDEIAEVKAVRPALIQSYIIRSRLELIRGNLEDAEMRLTYARELADDLRLEALVDVIDAELDNIEQQYQLLGIESDALPTAIKAANLVQLLRDVKNNQLLAKFDTMESPKFLIIINDGGMPIYSKKFTSNVNEYLISGFLTAITSFGIETFETTSYVNKLQFQGNSILLEIQDKITVAYAYEDDSKTTSKRFENFVTFVLSSEPIEQFLSTSTHRSLAKGLPAHLMSIIETAISNILLAE